MIRPDRFGAGWGAALNILGGSFGGIAVLVTRKDKPIGEPYCGRAEERRRNSAARRFRGRPQPSFRGIFRDEIRGSETIHGGEFPKKRSARGSSEIRNARRRREIPRFSGRRELLTALAVSRGLGFFKV